MATSLVCVPVSNSAAKSILGGMVSGFVKKRKKTRKASAKRKTAKRRKK